MTDQRIAGMIEIKSNGFILSGQGTFTGNLGQPKREGVRDTRKTVGYAEVPQTPFLEGSIIDFNTTHVKDDLLNLTNATITIKAGNNKTYMWEKAWFAGEGNIDFDKGLIEARFESIDAEEMG